MFKSSICSNTHLTDDVQVVDVDDVQVVDVDDVQVVDDDDVRVVNVEGVQEEKKKRKRAKNAGRKLAKKAKEHSSRPTFYVDDDNQKPVRAAGVIPYSIIDGELKFLVISRKDNYEDFGGKTSEEDISIHQTILREAYEESNGLFSPPMIYDHLVNPCYIARCKYIVYFVPVSSSWKSSDFGDIEYHEKISRKVEWVPIKTFMSKRHPRLNSDNFVTRIRRLSKCK